MKLLIITNLFPNSQEPNRSPFNFQQIKELAKLCELKVVAPVPCFQYSKEQVPYCENIEGIETYHPRYLVIPRILRSLYGIFFYLGILQTVRQINKEFAFDKIQATWAYPDAFGAALVARQLKKPLFMKVHGTDINVFTKYILRRAMIAFACRQAEKVIVVSTPLREKIKALGIPSEKIILIPNGIDCDKFRLMDKDECRSKLGLTHKSRHVTYIGNLEEIKGVRYLIQAFLNVTPDICLNIVGDGKERKMLEEMAGYLHLSRRIIFYGRRTHDEIPLWLNASDVLCLPSLNEGCPNVVLESLASGTPVVASRVGGVPDLITSPQQGILVEPANEQALAKAIKDLLAQKINRTQIRESVWGYDWQENAKKIMEVISRNK